jgi:RHS repeat-associated protein
LRDARGGEQRFQYDLLGQVLEARTPDGNVQRLTYDPEGNLIAYRDAHREVTYEYSGYHRLAYKQEDGAGTRFHRDTEDRLIAYENEVGERIQFVLDERGEPIEEIGFDGARRRFKRDRAGRVVEELRPSGLRTELRYDPAGRVVARKHSDGTWEEFAYRPDGALVRAANENGPVGLDRDPLGKIVAETQGAHTVHSKYDPNGRRVSVESSLEARLSALRSPAGKLEQVVMAGGAGHRPWAIEFDRDPMGVELGRRLPGGVVARWSRDEAGRPTSHQVRTGAGAGGTWNYEWDVGDQLRVLGEAARGPTRFWHDRRGRLAGAERPDGSREYRAPDRAGNLFKTPARTDRRYQAGGRLEQAGGATYQYDPDGNLAEKRQADGACWRYAWNGAGHLAEVTRPDGGKVAFTYDALGRRVGKRSAEGETRFVWDGDVLLHELSPRGAPTTWYFEPESHAPIAKEQDGKRWSVVTDHMGAPAEIYDDAGRLAWRSQLDTYGAGQPDVALTDCPWRWPGQYADAETGLHYNRFRYYDPDAGSYLSPDPVGIEAGPALYAYAPDPTTSVDPLGLTPDFATLMDMARNTLDFSTARDAATFWSGPRMLDAQAWAAANGKTTLEQTAGGKYLDGLNLFGPGSPLTPGEAAQVWDAASVRFAQGASGEVSVFSTGATRMGAWGERTWWRIERPALETNPSVTKIVRRRKDGTPCA